MRPRLALPLGLVPLLLLGCAAPRTAPVTSEPGADLAIAGVYQYETILNRGAEQGRPTAALSERVTGTIALEGSEGRYTGEITASGRSPMPITSVMVSRNEATLQARGGDGGPVTLRLVFQGDAFAGQWEASDGFVSRVTGVRRR